LFLKDKAVDNDDQKNEILRKKGNSLTIPTSNTGLIDQALSRLGEEQLKQISAKALDEALNLEAMGKRVGFEYQLGQRQLNDHIDTVNNLKNSGDKSHHEVSTTLKVGDNRVYVKSEIGRSKTCFVATTVYGDENHPDVERLRRYRDERLHKSVPGRIFIVAYYRFGECLARFVNKHPRLKNAVRSKLESFVRHLDKNGI
jgi:hypothetical protein